MRNTYRNTTIEIQRRITRSAPGMLGALLVFVVASCALLFFASLFGCAGPADAGGRTSGNAFSSAIYVQGNPNGRVTATKGTIAVDQRTTVLYQNTDGAKTWQVLAASSGVGDIDSITAGDGLVGDCTSGDCTIDAVCGLGLSCAPDSLDLRDDCVIGDYLVYEPLGEGGNEWQCANDVDRKLVREVVATTNGGLAVTRDTTYPYAFTEFVHLRTDCANGEVLKSGGAGTTWSCSADSGGVTNSAGANVVTKSNGTNLVASNITDDGTTVTVTTSALTLASTSTGLAPVTLTSQGTSGAAITINAEGAGGGVRILADDGVVAIDGADGLTLNGASFHRESGVPAVGCTKGDLYTRTDGAASTMLYVCGATDTWTALGAAPSESTTAPTLSSCGTGPTVAARNVTFGTSRIVSFTITGGTGSASACTATYASAFSAEPTCTATATNSGAAQTLRFSASSASAVTINSTFTIDGNKWHVTCVGSI